MESDDYHSKIVEPVLVYILEQHNLAAQYLLSVLSQASWITPRREPASVFVWRRCGRPGGRGNSEGRGL